MKLCVIGFGMALALASLCPATARTSGGFSSSHTTSTSKDSTSTSKESPSKPDTPAPRAGGGFTRTPPAAATPPAARQSNGFTSTPPPAAETTPPVTRQSGGFSSGSPSVVTSPPAARQANGFTASGNAAAVQRAAPVVASPVDRLAAKSQSQAAFKQYQNERAAYKSPEVNAPTDQGAARQSRAWQAYGSRWNNPNAYYAARNNAFATNPSYEHYYTNPPVYINRPSYGGYAAAFLGGVLLDRITEPSYATWAYSHADDPGYQAWHEDMNRQAADNDDLRAKMVTLDQQVATLKAQNVPKSDALPPGVDPSLVVAPSTALMATEPVSTGHPVLWTIAALCAGLAIFLAACVYVSQRKQRLA